MIPPKQTPTLYNINTPVPEVIPSPTTEAPATPKPPLKANDLPNADSQKVEPSPNSVSTPPSPPPSAQQTAPAQEILNNPSLIIDNEPKGILINFNNVSIIEFIRFISRASNKNFIFDDTDLQFNVTIVSEEPTSLSNILTALMQVMRVHGLSLIEQGNNILIHNNKAVMQVSQVVDSDIPHAEGKEAELITRVFRLNTLDAEKASIIIQPLISEGALVEVLKDTGHIIVTDLSTNVNKIGFLIKSLDAPQSGLAMGQYLVVNALIDSLVNLGQKVMDPITEGKTLVFVPHIPSNSIFVVSTPFLVDRALAVLRTLDINEGETRIFSPESLHFTGTSQEKQPRGKNGRPLTQEEREQEERERLERERLGVEGLPPGVNALESTSPWSTELPSGHIERTKFYIHKLRFRKGDQIVDALGRVGLSLEESGNNNSDLIQSIQSIQWLEASNSLVFTGTVASITKVRELIDEIDTPLRQVFIEMLIVDMSLNDSLDIGVNWGARFNNGNTAGAEAFISGANTLASSLDTAIPGGSLDPSQLARQIGFNLGIIGRNVTQCGVEFSSIGALVSAMHDKQKADILMNPKLLVEDNSTAEIFVGINTQFQTQAIANDQGSIITNNFEFRDVGTRFKVTPLISNNDIVTLDIEEEVSSVVTTPTTTASLITQLPGPTTRVSRTNTKVHVPNKFFLVMSGMVQDEQDRERQQVPCLGGIPIIGALFSNKTLNDTKRNIMIFIRPQIIDTDQDIDDITRHQQDIMRIKYRTKKMWKYEVDEALDLLNAKEPDVSMHDTEQFNP